jgi:hypothetical protein
MERWLNTEITPRRPRVPTLLLPPEMAELAS